MSCIKSSVYTQYLRQHSNWFGSLSFPRIFQTVNKSPDLLEGFDLFQVLLITQVKARFLAATWCCSLSSFFSNQDFYLADFLDGIF